MGNSARKCREDKPVKVVLFGLSGAGKSSLLYKMKLGEPADSHTYRGDTAVEDLQGQRLKLCVHDIGFLRSGLRPMYRLYLDGADAIVFVIDSSDKSTDNGRWDEAKDIIEEMFFNEKIKKLPLLILANKQDLPDCMTPEEVMKSLSLNMEKRKRPIAVLPTSATTGEGLEEAFRWIEEAISGKSVSDCAGGGIETKDEISSQKVSKRTHGRFIGSVVAYAKSLLSARSH